MDEPDPQTAPRRRFEASALQYWYALWIVGGLALLGTPVEILLGYHAVGFLFLCGILSLGLFYSFGPVLFAALLSAGIWDYFFIPPRFNLTVATGEDSLLILALILSALITGVLTRQIRRDQRELEGRERDTQLLYELGAALTKRPLEKALSGAESVLAQAFGSDVALMLGGRGGRLDLEARSDYPFRIWGADLESAEKAMRTLRPTPGTRTTSQSFLFLPLPGTRDAQGVMAYRLRADAPLEGKQRQRLESAARRIGLSLEREMLERRSREADRLRESEQLHQALLDSVSHELRTPLTALLGSAAALRDEAALGDPVRKAALLDQIGDAGERLNRVIENLLDMARLSSGALALKREWQDPAELARLTAERLHRALSRHKLVLELPQDLPLIWVDYRLIEHALSNLLLNAASYAPEGTRIRLGARVVDGHVELSVADEGPGIPPDCLERLFQRFYRVPGSPAGGTGLGLYIAQSLLRAHGGEARALNRDAGGAEFFLRLPLQAQPSAPAEER